MGILDDAIREHLELKRQHGADTSDLDRLEKEAFGPAKRPGDEGATGPGASEGDGLEDPSADHDYADHGYADDGDASAFEEAPTRVESAEPGRGFFDHLADEGDEEPALEDEHVVEEHRALGAEEDPAAFDQVEGVEAPFADADEIPSAEQGRTDYSELEDTADHATVDDPEADDSDAPVESPESAIFADEEVELGEFEIGLEDQRSTDVPPSADEPAELEQDAPEAESPGSDQPFGYATPAPDQPLEGEPEPLEMPPTSRPEPELSDPELDLSLEDDDEDSAPPALPGGTQPDLERQSEPQPEPGADDDEEDLLEETPDFLEDAPEGERLWFEQGEPKDFDFDD